MHGGGEGLGAGLETTTYMYVRDGAVTKTVMRCPMHSGPPKNNIRRIGCGINGHDMYETHIFCVSATKRPPDSVQRHPGSHQKEPYIFESRLQILIELPGILILSFELEHGSGVTSKMQQDIFSS